MFLLRFSMQIFFALTPRTSRFTASLLAARVYCDDIAGQRRPYISPFAAALDIVSCCLFRYFLLMRSHADRPASSALPEERRLRAPAAAHAYHLAGRP